MLKMTYLLFSIIYYINLLILPLTCLAFSCLCPSRREDKVTAIRDMEVFLVKMFSISLRKLFDIHIVMD